jgi:hypothetical protein
LKRLKNPAHRDEKRTDIVCLRHGGNAEIPVQGHGGRSLAMSVCAENWPALCLANFDPDRAQGGGALCR